MKYLIIKNRTICTEFRRNRDNDKRNRETNGRYRQPCRMERTTVSAG